MSFFPRRSKIISFRVSEEEYGQLLRASSESGAHSVSDWARAATFAQSGNPSLTAGNSHCLQTRVEELHREVQRLSELIDAKR